MLLQRLLTVEPALRSSEKLLEVRLCVFGAAWAHLCIAAIAILPQDMSLDEDPNIKIYAHLKYWFITAWFNFINLAYLPLCIYCDWKEKRGQENEKLVCRLRRVRDILFTSILFPTIMWADSMFWRFYHKDPTLISPTRLFDYMPSWGQHSLHTVSGIMVILDLFLTPRRRPVSVIPRLYVMTAFFVVYLVAILERYTKGEYVYAVQKKFTGFETLLFVVMCYLEYLVFFTLQWLVIKWLWGKKKQVQDCS